MSGIIDDLKLQVAPSLKEVKLSAKVLGVPVGCPHEPVTYDPKTNKIGLPGVDKQNPKDCVYAILSAQGGPTSGIGVTYQPAANTITIDADGQATIVMKSCSGAASEEFEAEFDSAFEQELAEQDEEVEWPTMDPALMEDAKLTSEGPLFTELL